MLDDDASKGMIASAETAVVVIQQVTTTQMVLSTFISGSLQYLLQMIRPL